ncbi:chromosome segregation ATPase family protein [Histoplasma capsulatum G186AR]|nr:chromosome segregation ATPase family protein [Histoplasma capsulatum]QSS67833.1 chromosome segregation ATPase family protein [Histoplasma capsulatum G186AR]
MDNSNSRPETPVPQRNTQQGPAAGTPHFGRGYSSTAIAPGGLFSEQATETSIHVARMPTTLGVRPSRASSIISTMTTSTIATLQDDDRSTRSARSIDLMLGGRLFHINRDGSKISSSSDNDLPPYSPSLPTYAQSSNQTDASFLNGAQPPEPTTPTARSPSSQPTPVPKSRIHIPFWTDRSRHRRQPSDISQSDAKSSLGRLSSNSMFDLSNLPSASLSNRDSQTMEDHAVYRSPSFVPGPETISVIPKGRSASQGNIPESVHSRHDNEDSYRRLRRRNGVRLPRLFTSLTNIKFSGPPDESPSPGGDITQSAGPSFATCQRKCPQSPVNTTRSSGGNPAPSYPTHLSPDDGFHQRRPSLPNIPMLSLAVPQSPARIEEGHVGIDPPPPMEDENDVSIHYTRLIRSIDRDHRKALHVRDRELAGMRERLNEIDQVYRQELKSRDFTIDDMRKRLENLQEQMNSYIERAKNEVEDMWETRWKDRDRHLMERMRRIELESQIQVEKAVAERDKEWVAEWEKRNEGLLERLRASEGSAAGQHS